MENGEVRPSVLGVPQGGVISPLLANIYLHALDALWEEKAASLGHLVRYADDMVVLCTTEEAADAAWRGLVGMLTGLKLEAHPEKTRVLALADGTQGFDFLGFVCHEHKRRLTSVGRSLNVMLHRRWREVLRSRPAGGGSKPPQAASAQRPRW